MVAVGRAYPVLWLFVTFSLRPDEFVAKQNVLLTE